MIMISIMLKQKEVFFLLLYLIEGRLNFVYKLNEGRSKKTYKTITLSILLIVLYFTGFLSNTE